MRIINVSRSTVVETFDGPTELITPALLEKLLGPVEENKLRILSAFESIEAVINEILTFYFFGPDKHGGQQAGAFRELILSSDWCAFSAKRKLLLHIVNDTNVLKGPDKNECDELVRRCMGLRNAFAHGTISTDGRTIKLAYFEGAPRNVVLDDDYFAKVEAAYNRCLEVVHRVAIATRALKAGL